MKKKLLFILVFLCAGCAVAFSQEKNGVFVEFSGGFSNERDIEYYHHPAILTPGIGYKINDKWAVGMRASFELGIMEYKGMNIITRRIAIVFSLLTQGFRS